MPNVRKSSSFIWLGATARRSRVRQPGFSLPTELADNRRHWRNLHKEVLLQEGLNADLLDDMHAADILDEAGDVDGPDSATVCNAACFANTDGKSIQDSGVPTGKIVQADAAFTADNRLTKTDRPSSDNRNIQQTGITVDDNDNVSGIANLAASGTISAPNAQFDEAVVTSTIEFPGGYYITIGPSGGIGFFDSGDNLLMEVGTLGGGTHVTGKLDVDGDVDPPALALDVVSGLDRPSTRTVKKYDRTKDGKFVLKSEVTKPVAHFFIRDDEKACFKINGKTFELVAVESK
jgi:hypothetical protein